MYKIAISGKANSGKNTVSKLLKKEFKCKKGTYEYIAFADPIKQMIREMFPLLSEECLTGSSDLRATEIENSFKDTIPLTVRQLLIDLGTLGRSYNEKIWLDVFNVSLNYSQITNKELVIVTDVRFKNEFEHLKNLGFYQIRLLRNNITNTAVINKHATETEQETIKDEEFNYIIHNDGTLKDLKKVVKEIVSNIKS